MSEHDQQCAVVDWCDLHGIPVFAIPNGGMRCKRTAAMLKAEGVKAGVPLRAISSASLEAGFAGYFNGCDLLIAVVTHASNLTGDIYDVAKLAEIAHAHGAIVVVDAAQTAGCLPIDMTELGIDVLCCTGHKALMGQQGTGCICVGDNVDIPPFKVGGSGTHSFDLNHPPDMPECLEADTLNGHGICTRPAPTARRSCIALWARSTKEPSALA